MQSVIDFLSGDLAATVVWPLLFLASEVIGGSGKFKSSTVLGFLKNGIKVLYTAITKKNAPDMSGAGDVIQSAKGILGLATIAPLGFFGTISVVIQTINQGIALVNRISQAIEKQKLGEWMGDLEKTTGELEKATTPEEKLRAAKNLANLTRRLN
jgi:hypothetical protein